jgi:SAM-dependent methyltransferase
MNAEIDQQIQETQDSYDSVAVEYTRRIYDELKHKPLDRMLLDRLVAAVGELGPICDLGCGPGHVARYLRDQGAQVLGVDLSPGMVAEAQRLNPDIPFLQDNMMALQVLDDSWGGIVAFYSILHAPRAQVVDVLREWKRVLRPSGHLLLAFHRGNETVHADEFFEIPVSLDFLFFERVEMEGYLQAAGFEIEETVERPPYPDVEHQSHRVYIFGRKSVTSKGSRS